MAGHDLEVDGPRYVSLEIDMHVCVEPDYFRADVKANCSTCSATASWPTAGAVCFIRINFTFGQTVYLSPLIAAAQARRRA